MSTEALMTAACGSTIAGQHEPAFSLVVAMRHNIVGEAAAEIVATEDGRHADLSAWHEGDSDPEREVYYERIAADGSGSHGFVDADSRKIVQAG